MPLLLYHLIKGGSIDSPKYKCWKVLETVASHLESTASIIYHPRTQNALVENLLKTISKISAQPHHNYVNVLPLKLYS